MFLEKGILCGINLAKIVYELLDKKIKFTSFKNEGDGIKTNDVLAKVEGPAISLSNRRKNSLKFSNSSFWHSNININDGTIDFRNYKILQARK